MKLTPQLFEKRYANLGRVEAIREWRAIQSDSTYTHEERRALWNFLLHGAREGGYVVPFHPEVYRARRAKWARADQTRTKRGVIEPT